MYRKTYRSGWHGAVNLLNKIYSYFGAIGAADTSIHMQGKQLFIVHAAFLSQYLECLLNVAQSCTSYHKLVRGRAILQCNSLDSSWISLGLLYHTVTSWTIIFHDTVKHEYFMNSYIWPFKWH